MARRKQAAGKMVRVAEGVYRRDDAYLVPIYHSDLKGPGKGGKRWHSLTNCGPECEHDQIVDLDSAKDAKRQLEQQKRDARSGNAKANLLVKEWAGSSTPGATPLWLQRFPRNGETTMAHLAERVRFFVDEFGERSLRSLTDEEVSAWAAKHDGRAKEVRTCLNDALKVRPRVLEENPLRDYKFGQRRGRADIQTLSVEELDTMLLPIARNEWGDYGANMEALIELGAWTGMRPGELFMLSTEPGNDLNGGRVNFIDLEQNLIDVQWQWNVHIRKVTRPKWDSQRKVVLLPRARAAVEHLPKTPEGWVFLTQRLARFTQRNLHYYWDPVRRAFTKKLPASHWLPLRIEDAKGAARKAGKPYTNEGNLDFYELRHYFGTALAHPPAGIRPASPYEIAQQMGHKDGGALAMRTYIHTKDMDVVRDLSAAWADHAPRPRSDVA